MNRHGSLSLRPGKSVTGTVPIEQAGAVIERMHSFGLTGMDVINAW